MPSIRRLKPNAPGAPQTLGTVSAGHDDPTVAAAPVPAPPARRSISPIPRAAVRIRWSPRHPPARRRRTNSTSLTASWCARTTRWPRTASAISSSAIRATGRCRRRPIGSASLFQRQRYRDAAEAFLNVSTKYRSSAKAPDALFRLGQSLAALGRRRRPARRSARSRASFPKSSAALKQSVEREQKRVRC